jgi:hypothetical protein
VKKRSLHKPVMEKNSVSIINANFMFTEQVHFCIARIAAIRAMQNCTCSVNMKLALMIVSAFTGILLYMIDEC